MRLLPYGLRRTRSRASSLWHHVSRPGGPLSNLAATNWPDGRARRSLGDLAAVAQRAKAEAGANHFRLSEIVSSPEIKNISVYQNINQAYVRPVPPDKRGVAHVTNARWDAVDAEVTKTIVAGAYGEVVWS